MNAGPLNASLAFVSGIVIGWILGSNYGAESSSKVIVKRVMLARVTSYTFYNT